MKIWTIWLIVAGFFAILEIATTGFLVLWLGVAALASMVFSIFMPEAIVAQIVIWAVISSILILFSKKLVKKIEPPTVNTNVYSIIGKRAIVSQEINVDKAQGQIKVDGDAWSATTDVPGEIIPVNTAVEVVKIDGVKAVVQKISETEKVSANS